MSSMSIKWMTFPRDLLSLYLAVHFLRMWLRGIMSSTNSNGDSASPWNMLLWIFTSAKLFPPTVNSTLQIIIIIIIIHSLELFPSALADGFSLESE